MFVLRYVANFRRLNQIYMRIAFELNSLIIPSLLFDSRALLETHSRVVWWMLLTQ